MKEIQVLQSLCFSAHTYTEISNQSSSTAIWNRLPKISLSSSSKITLKRCITLLSFLRKEDLTSSRNLWMKSYRLLLPLLRLEWVLIRLRWMLWYIIISRFRWRIICRRLGGLEEMGCLLIPMCFCKSLTTISKSFNLPTFYYSKEHEIVSMARSLKEKQWKYFLMKSERQL